MTHVRLEFVESFLQPEILSFLWKVGKNHSLHPVPSKVVCNLKLIILCKSLVF